MRFKLTFPIISFVIAPMLLLATIFTMISFQVVANFDGTAELPADCAVVFGSAVHKGSRAGPGILRRGRTAAGLYNDGLITERLVLTGGQGSPELDSEAMVLSRVLEAEGVPASAIALEQQARSTWENLQYSRPLLEGCESVVGISDRYHLARIDHIAELQGWPELETYPAKWHANRWFETRSVIREAVAIIYYSARYWNG